MFGVLLESKRPMPRPHVGVVLSAAIHLALGAALLREGTTVGAPAPESFISRVLFLPPRDKVVASAPQGERVQWLSYGIPTGAVPQFTDLPLGQSVSGRPSLDPMVGRTGDAPTNVDPSPLIIGGDTAFSILDVDTAVARDPSSAAPMYPAALLASKVQGSVRLQYVVDTTGLADTASARVVRSSHPEFTRAVLTALAGMKFRPATMGSRRVPQWVEQDFGFRIADASTEPAGPPAP